MRVVQALTTIGVDSVTDWTVNDADLTDSVAASLGWARCSNFKNKICSNASMSGHHQELLMTG